SPQLFELQSSLLIGNVDVRRSLTSGLSSRCIVSRRRELCRRLLNAVRTVRSQVAEQIVQLAITIAIELLSAAIASQEISVGRLTVSVAKFAHSQLEQLVRRRAARNDDWDDRRTLLLTRERIVRCKGFGWSGRGLRRIGTRRSRGFRLERHRGHRRRGRLGRR